MKANKREDRMKQLIITLILTTSLFANEKTWSSHSAEILEQGRWEIGLFQPLRYGYSNYAEFSIHPVWFFLIPNLEIKESQKSLFGCKTASQYRLTYPTMLLNMLSVMGLEKLLPQNTIYPTCFPFQGLLLALEVLKTLSYR